MLRRKLVRSLTRGWGQALAVSVVFALGVASFTGVRGAYLGVGLATQRVYRQLGLPDLVARVDFAPLSVVRALRAIPGVRVVVPRLDLDTSAVGLEGVTVHVLSVPEGAPALGRVRVVRGRGLSGGAVEALVAVAAAASGRVAVGEELRLRAARGGVRRVRVVGLALQPEHLAMIAPQGYMATPESFMAVYLPEVEARALLGRSGGATEFELGLTSGADERAVAAAVRRVLRPYRVTVTAGGELASVRNVRVHTEALASAGLVFPAVFLLAAALGAYVVLSRLVRLERGFVGLMRAQGVHGSALVGHYLAYAGVMAGVGVLVGLPAGVPVAAAVRRIFAADLGAPADASLWHPGLAALAAGVALAAGLAGAALPAWVAARVPPAEALRSEPPAGGAWWGVVGLARLPDVRLRLAARGVFRSPLRASLALVGVASAVTLAVAPALMLLEMGRVQARVDGVRRYDLRVVPRGVEGRAWLDEVAATAGVTAAEGVLQVPVTLERGGVSTATYVVGLEPGSRLMGVAVPPVGSAYLAAGLPGGGGRVTLRGPLGSVTLAAAGRVDFPLGRPVVVSLEDAERLVALAPSVRRLLEGAVGPALLGPREPVTGALVRVGAHQGAAVARRLAALPSVERVDSRAQERRDLGRIFRLSRAFIAIIEAFAVALAMALLYSVVTVSAAERRAEFAALRMLGLQSWEVAATFVGEMVAIAAAGWLVGVPAGWWVAQLALGGFRDFLPGGVPLDAVAVAWVAVGTLLVVLAAALPALRRLGTAGMAAGAGAL